MRKYYNRKVTVKTVERDKEPYEKDYQAEWRKCVELLRRCHDMLNSPYAIKNTRTDILLREIEEII